MLIETINHQVNIDFIRKTQISITYEKSNNQLFTKLYTRIEGTVETIIYFGDTKTMEDFQNCLKNPDILFYSHPKVSIVTTRYSSNKRS
jgi:ribonuclease BN (tRNA processing enzyme)